MMISFKLDGEMQSKKNQWKHGPNGVYIPGKLAGELDDFLWQLKNVRTKNKMSGPIDQPMAATFYFYFKKEKDLDNMVTTLLDLLQKGGIIKNDSLIMSILASKHPCMKSQNPTCNVALSTL